MLKAGKLSYLIKELKQSNGKDQAKSAKEGETLGKDKPLAILMVQPWQRVAKRRITKKLSPESVISFPTLGDEDGMEGSMIIEAKIGGNFVHRMYVNRGSSLEILYEYCFNRFHTEVKSQMVPATTPLVGFSGEIIWLLGKVTIPIQRNHRKARSNENLGCFVYSSRNAKILSDRRYGHIVELHDYSIRLYNGFRTSSAAARNQPSHRRKNSGSDSSRISRTNYSNRLYFNRRRAKGALRNIQRKVTSNGLRKRKRQIKKLLEELPMLTAPKEKEEFVIYLAAAKEAISTVLMTKRNGKQMLIYFVSHALQGPKTNYTPMEKLILALRFELEEHDINYRPRTSVKGQIIENFIVERSEDDPSDTPIEDKEELLDPWILFTDGSSCIDSFGVGIIITNPEGIKLTYSLRFGFDATNNEAEYEALIAGLWIAIQMGVKNLQENVDSRLVANKLNETYIAKEPSMIKYFKKGKTLPGIDIAGPFLKGPNKVKFMIVAIDYFTKWIEAKPVATITQAQIKKFMWDNIVCRFDLPGEIISENEKQFRDNSFKDWCEKLCIRQCFAFVKHLQANGWVEKANRSLDLLEEKREQVAIQEAKSKAMMEKYYNARIRNTSFKLGDLVYQSNEASHADDNSDLSGKDHMRLRKH
nr:reverse transcriptase domain-containing protein [Tanacetum cinerariifolium]